MTLLQSNFISTCADLQDKPGTNTYSSDNLPAAVVIDMKSPVKTVISYNTMIQKQI